MLSALKSAGLRVLIWVFPLLVCYVLVLDYIGLRAPLAYDAGGHWFLADHGLARVASAVFWIAFAGLVFAAILDVVLEWRAQHRPND
jgi:hypothetical protein